MVWIEAGQSAEIRNVILDLLYAFIEPLNESCRVTSPQWQSRIACGSPNVVGCSGFREFSGFGMTPRYMLSAWRLPESRPAPCGSGSHLRRRLGSFRRQPHTGGIRCEGHAAWRGSKRSPLTCRPNLSFQLLRSAALTGRAGRTVSAGQIRPSRYDRVDQTVQVHRPKTFASAADHWL